MLWYSIIGIVWGVISLRIFGWTWKKFWATKTRTEHRYGYGTVKEVPAHDEDDRKNVAMFVGILCSFFWPMAVFLTAIAVVFLTVYRLGMGEWPWTQKQ